MCITCFALTQFSYINLIQEEDLCLERNHFRMKSNNVSDVSHFQMSVSALLCKIYHFQRF